MGQKTASLSVKIKVEDKFMVSIFIATPIMKEDKHEIQADYVEVRPGVWRKVFGSEKDLGPTNQAPKTGELAEK